MPSQVSHTPHPLKWWLPRARGSNPMLLCIRLQEPCHYKADLATALYQRAWPLFTCLRLPHRPGKEQNFFFKWTVVFSHYFKDSHYATRCGPEWAETGVTLPVVMVPTELLLEKILPCKTASSFSSAPYSAHCEWLQAERTLVKFQSYLFP